MDAQQTMQEAMAALHTGLRGKAEDILLRLVAAYPDHAEAWLNLGNLAVQGKRAEIALERFQKVLAIRPDQPQALLWTGVLLSYRGQFSNAIAYLESANSAKPNDLQVLVPLAQCRYQLRRLDSAIEAFDAAIKLKPGDPDLLLSRATCLAEALRFREAQADLSAALPRKAAPAGFALMAEIHQKFGRSAEALNQAERALRLDPKNAQALLTAANALLNLGRADEAEQHWNRAEKLVPSRAAFLNSKAKAYLDQGKFDRAQEILLESMAAEPTFGETYYSYLSSKRVSNSDQAVLHMVEELLSRADLRDHDRVFLLYAAGKAKSDLNEFESALQCFDDANALKLRSSGSKPFDRDRFKAYFDAQAAIYTADFIREMQAFGSPSASPIFILGMMRSGTSLMEQILSCHPEIGGAGEQAFWHEHEAEVHRPGSSELNVAAILPLAEKFEALLRSAAPGFDRIIDKNPASAMLAGLLAVAYPNSKIINMRRHSVDTALSIWLTPMRTTAPFTATRGDIVFAYQQYQALSRHWESAIDPSQFKTVSYEDLTASPESVIRDAVAFCGVPWDPACLHPEANPRPVLTPSFWQVRQPLYRGSTERWRQYEPWLGEFASLMP